jgi:hypothetical protein
VTTIAKEQINQWCKWSLNLPAGRIMEGNLLRSPTSLALRYLASKNPESQYEKKKNPPMTTLTDNVKMPRKPLFLLEVNI